MRLNSYISKLFPVPEIIACDATDENAIKAPYVIQKFAPGGRLDDVLTKDCADLTTAHRFRIGFDIADLILRMQGVLNPTSGRLVSGPNTPNRCDDVNTLTTILVVAPFKIDEGEVYQSTSCVSVADFFRGDFCYAMRKKY